MQLFSLCRVSYFELNNSIVNSIVRQTKSNCLKCLLVVTVFSEGPGHVMQAVASILEFPGLEVVTGPSKIDKPLKGYGAFLYNDFIGYSKINVTLIVSSSAGYGCSLKNDSQTSAQSIICHGLFETLQKCQADFSLFPLSSHDYDHRMPFIPVLTGPQSESVEMCLFGYNSTAESKTSVYGITRIDMYVYIPLILLLLCIFAINTFNVKLQLNLRPRILRYSGWRPMVMMLALRNPKFKKKILCPNIWRFFYVYETKAALFLLFLLLMLCSTIMMVFVQTNSILKSPPRYLDLLDVVRNESLKIIYIDGISTQDYLKRLPHPAIQQLFHPESEDRIIVYPSTQLPSLADSLIRNPSLHFLLSNKIVTEVVKSLICNIWNQEGRDATPPWFTKSTSFLEIAGVASYSPCIKPELRKRLDIMFNRLTHSHLWAKFATDGPLRVPVANEEKHYLCVKNAPPFNSMSSGIEDQANDRLFLFIVSSIVFAAGILLSIVIFLIEIIISFFIKRGC